MKRVAQSEYDLLTMARALTGGVSAEMVEPLLRQERTMAPGLGPTSVGLLKQIIAQGVIHDLGRRGGWRPARHVNQGQVVAGRLWERHPVRELSFSGWTVALLRWLVSSPLAVASECQPLSVKGAPTVGDQLMLYLACDLARRCDCAEALGATVAVRQSPLCWVGFPTLLGRQPPRADELTDAALDALIDGGGFVLEALQQDLCRRWIAVERAKADVARPEEMIAVGASQQVVLERLAAALTRTGRQDLMGFMLEAAGWLLRHRPAAIHWVRGITQVGSLSQRQQAFRAAGAFLEALQIPARWVEQAQSVRFFDDEYETSQLLLTHWEQVGPEGLIHARQLVQQMQALDAPLLERVDDARPMEQVS